MGEGPAPPSSASPASGHGTPLEKYRVIAELGRGGMATVYLAVASGMSSFRKLCVLKRLRSDFALDAEFLEMFLEEARLAARLNHPNVIHTYEVGQDRDGYFIAMEYLDGVSLQAIIAKSGYNGRFTFGHFLRVFIDALAGLDYAANLTDYDGTALKIVHRDVSPHNLAVTFDGQSKLLDFGIAKAANSSIETKTGVVKGKVTYMAPEQAMSHDVDTTADIYAVGVMLWETVAGKRRWYKQTGPAVLQQLIENAAPMSPNAAARGLPVQLDAICLKALAHDPRQRYQTAAEFANDLEEIWPLLTASGGKRVTAKEVGVLTSELFAEDRERRRSIVDKQLKLLEKGELEIVKTEAIGTAPESSSAPFEQHDVHEGTAATVTTGQGAAISAANGSTQVVPLLQPKAKSLAPVVFAGGSFLVLAAGVGLYWSSTHGPAAVATIAPPGLTADPTGAPPATQSASAASASPTSTAGKATIAITLPGVPASAAVTIDGNPAMGRDARGALVVERDDLEHTVQVVGYAPKRIRFDAAQVVTLEPQRGVRGPVAVPTAASTATAPAAATSTAPPSGASTIPRPKVTIDPQNPFLPPKQ